jgi:hypothetical protein
VVQRTNSAHRDGSRQQNGIQYDQSHIHELNELKNSAGTRTALLKPIILYKSIQTPAKHQETPRRRLEDPVNLDPEPRSPDRLHLIPDLLAGSLTFRAEEEIGGSAKTSDTTRARSVPDRMGRTRCNPGKGQRGYGAATKRRSTYSDT